MKKFMSVLLCIVTVFSLASIVAFAVNNPAAAVVSAGVEEPVVTTTTTTTTAAPIDMSETAMKVIELFTGLLSKVDWAMIGKILLQTITTIVSMFK